MEQVEIELADFTLRCRSVAVSHRGAGLARGLEPGEQLLLHDRRRGWFLGRVADLDFTATDTLYRIQVGVRLTDGEAAERLSGAAPAAGPGAVAIPEVLDLLGVLAGRPVPSARPLAPASQRRRPVGG
jgi:hypothetical protein